jgi:hypothetical protein
VINTRHAAPGFPAINLVFFHAFEHNFTIFEALCQQKRDAMPNLDFPDAKSHEVVFLIKQVCNRWHWVNGPGDFHDQ